MNVLFFIAIAILFGFLVSKVINRLRLPGVVGYLIAGLILGPSIFNCFSESLLDKLGIFTSITLSLVAFMIGSEIKLSAMSGMGKGIAAITLLESFGAFIVVAAGVYLLTKKLYLALIFGAIAPASSPAGTVAVLQENKAKGRLTSAIYAVVGLDDGLAVMIFALAVAMAKFSFTGKAISAGTVLTGPVFEIAGSIVLGILTGLVTGVFIRKISGKDSILAISIGAILVCTGIAEYFDFSLILANLTLGVVFVNLFPVENRKAYRAIKSISLPIYIIFFFLAGAHLQLRLLPSIGILGAVYIVCRIVGLIGGAYLGAVVSKQNAIIRKYLGFGILSQAGVAIGLAVLAADRFGSLGQEWQKVALVVVNIIAASTIFFEIIGPISTKFAISKAGEIGVNITEEDLIEERSVSDVMDSKPPIIFAGSSLREVIDLVSNTDRFYYPVVDSDKKLIGVITLDGIRQTFHTEELNDWLVALDIMEPLVKIITPEVALSEAFKQAERLDINDLPVTSSKEDKAFVGILNCRAVHRALSTEVLDRQRKADSMHIS